MYWGLSGGRKGLVVAGGVDRRARLRSRGGLLLGGGASAGAVLFSAPESSDEALVAVAASEPAETVGLPATVLSPVAMAWSLGTVEGT